MDQRPEAESSRRVPIVGVKEIDDDHREILFFLAQIKTNKENTPKILDVLSTFVQKHFAAEERLLRDACCPKPMVDSHSRDHARIQDLFVDGLVCQAPTCEQLDAFRVAILDHIGSFDMVMAEWCRMVQFVPKESPQTES